MSSFNSENLRRKLISSVSDITRIEISQPRRIACVRIEIGRTPYLNEFVDVDSTILPKRGSARFNERQNRFFPVLRVHIPRFDVIQKNLAKLEKMSHFRKTFAFFQLKTHARICVTPFQRRQVATKRRGPIRTTALCAANARCSSTGSIHSTEAATATVRLSVAYALARGKRMATSAP